MCCDAFLENEDWDAGRKVDVDENIDEDAKKAFERDDQVNEDADVDGERTCRKNQGEGLAEDAADGNGGGEWMCRKSEAPVWAARLSMCTCTIKIKIKGTILVS